MSRAKGHNGEQVKRLEQEENAAAAKWRIEKDAKLIRLQVEQARRTGDTRPLETTPQLIESIIDRLKNI